MHERPRRVRHRTRLAARTRGHGVLHRRGRAHGVAAPEARVKMAIAFACGVLFAVGLGVSGMLQPTRVIGFLDFFGEWDPTLLGVMVGAIPVYLLAWSWRRGRA